MCRCTPEMRTPFCGKPGCEMPPQKVVPITGTTLPAQLGEPRAAVIAALESALAKAKTGELQSFIGCGFTSSGARLSLWANDRDDVYAMLGSLAWLQHEYVHRVTGEKP